MRLHSIEAQEEKDTRIDFKVLSGKLQMDATEESTGLHSRPKVT